MSAAARRTKRIVRQRGALGARATKVFIAGPLAGAQYGAEVHGMSDGEVLKIRRVFSFFIYYHAQTLAHHCLTDRPCQTELSNRPAGRANKNSQTDRPCQTELSNRHRPCQTELSNRYVRQVMLARPPNTANFTR